MVENLANSSRFTAWRECRLEQLPHALEFVSLPIPKELGEPIVVRVTEKALRLAMEYGGEPFLPILGRGCPLVPARNDAFVSLQSLG